jgi:putative transcriptional regulator
MSHPIIGNCVKDKRIKAGLTQAELAGLVGIARISITSIETGRHIPTIDTALRLSQFLDVPVNDLFWIKEEKI